MPPVNQPALFPERTPTDSNPVECLGLTFENDAARRAYFTEKLREKLQDPTFRQIEGFPHGSDEDILALSDPPYYTACPNPFLENFVKHCGKPYDPTDLYHREPFAEDVSEGKDDPAYNVHAYPTKVPPGAIIPLIEHYTEPGGVVLDPFCGTGMTGVALDEATKVAFGVMQDLSPAATHITSSLTSQIDLAEFEDCSNKIFTEISDQYKWMYETTINGKTKEVRYFVWSDIYICDSCGHPIRIWDIEGEKSIGGLKQKRPCSHCGALISKSTMLPLHETVYDRVLGYSIERIKSEPVLKVIVTRNKSLKTIIEKSDIELLRGIESLDIPFIVPTEKMLFKDGVWGDQWRSSYHHGVTHAHHFYTYRNLCILAAFWAKIQEVKEPALRKILQFWFTASNSRLTRLNRYMAQHNRHVGPLAGTLFIGPIQAEISPFYFFSAKQKDITSLLKSSRQLARQAIFASTGSSSNLPLSNNSVDYIFTDPPFGENLMYSELNFLVECWLSVFTNQKPEAVISNTQGKNIVAFNKMMEKAFCECWQPTPKVGLLWAV